MLASAEPIHRLPVALISRPRSRWIGVKKNVTMTMKNRRFQSTRRFTFVHFNSSSKQWWIECFTRVWIVTCSIYWHVRHVLFGNCNLDSLGPLYNNNNSLFDGITRITLFLLLSVKAKKHRLMNYSQYCIVLFFFCRHLENLGTLSYKMRVHANDDVYETTRHRMAVAEENNKNKW